jgi:L-amino acid N-acyltransferase YncA
LQIRPVRPSDTEAVADVYLSAISGMTYLPQLYTEDETREFIRAVLLPNNEVWVAEEAGALVGFVGFGDGSLRHLWVRADNQSMALDPSALFERSQVQGSDAMHTLNALTPIAGWRTVRAAPGMGESRV